MNMETTEISPPFTGDVPLRFYSGIKQHIKGKHVVLKMPERGLTNEAYERRKLYSQ